MRPTTAIIVTVTAAFASLGLDYSHYPSRQGPAAAASGAPQLILETSNANLGSVFEDTVPIAHIPIRNAGQRRLIVRRETCCGEEFEEPLLLAPGGTSVLTVRMDVAGRRGLVQQNVAYTTSDPQQPRFEINLTAEVSGNDP